MTYLTNRLNVLVASDVASKGLDFDINHVINYDMPKYPQTYIHRIGRSGRFGRKGVAINFVNPKEKNILNYIQKLYNTEIIPLPSNVSELI